MKQTLALLLPAALLSGCAQQAPQQPVGTPTSVPVPAPLVARVPARPAVITLPGAICEPARTGETILRVQTAVNKLMPRVEVDPAYGGAWYEHSPCHRIVLAFKDGQPRQWVIDAAEPELRPYIGFGRAPYTLAESELARLEIGAAIAAAGLRSVFVVGRPGDKFGIVVRTEADAQTVMRVIPDRYRADVSIFVGDIEPRPER